MVPSSARDAQQRAEFPDAGRVHAVGGFVEQQQRRQPQQRDRQPEPLPHALRVRLHLAVGDLVQRDPATRRRSIGPRAGSGGAAPRQQIQVAAAGQPRVERWFVDHRTDPGEPAGSGTCRPFSQARPAVADRPAGCACGRLACAVPPQEAEHLARLDRRSSRHRTVVPRYRLVRSSHSITAATSASAHQDPTIGGTAAAPCRQRAGRTWPRPFDEGQGGARSACQIRPGPGSGTRSRPPR